jgi:hypothetical protein
MACSIAIPGGGNNAPMLAVIQYLKAVNAERLAASALAAGICAPHVRDVAELLHFLP